MPCMYLVLSEVDIDLEQPMSKNICVISNIVKFKTNLKVGYLQRLHLVVPADSFDFLQMPCMYLVLSVCKVDIDLEQPMRKKICVISNIAKFKSYYKERNTYSNCGEIICHIHWRLLIKLILFVAHIHPV